MAISGVSAQQWLFLTVIVTGVPLLRAVAGWIAFRMTGRKQADVLLTLAEFLKSWGLLVATAGFGSFARAFVTPGSRPEAVVTSLSAGQGPLVAVIVAAKVGALAVLGFLLYVATLVYWSRLRILGQATGEMCLDSRGQCLEIREHILVFVQHYVWAGLMFVYGGYLSGPVER